MQTPATRPPFLNTAKLRAWLWVWSLPGILLGVYALIRADRGLLLATSAQIILTLLLGSLNISRRLLRVISLSLFTLIAIASFLEANLNSRVWYTPQQSPLIAALTPERITSSAVRAWRVHNTDEPLLLSFEARLAAGQLGWDWFRSNNAFTLTPQLIDGTLVTTVVTPTGNDPYLMRTFDTGYKTGGRTFRAELEMRADETIPPAPCRGLWLQTWGVRALRKCADVTLTPEWQTVTLEWTVGQEVTSHVIRVVLNNLDGFTYQIRNFRLSEIVGDSAVILGPSLQEAMNLQLQWGSNKPEAHSGSGFVPGGTWQPFSFVITPPARKPPMTLLATLTVGSGQVTSVPVEIRRTKLSPVSSVAATKHPAVTRVRLWLGHPNIAAHAVLALALLLVTLSPSFLASVLTMGVALVVVFLTGSRTALFVTLILTGIFLMRKRPRAVRAAPLASFLLIMTNLTTLLVAQFLDSRVFSLDESVRRLDIWELAWQAFVTHPWFGLGGGQFAAFWQTHYQGASREVVTHAHNLWLFFASSYGLFGLIAIVWFTLGLLWLSWRWGRYDGLVISAGILAMNFFDYTLFTFLVFCPLILSLNVLGAPRSTPIIGLSRSNKE